MIAPPPLPAGPVRRSPAGPEGLTIVTPSFEKHAVQFGHMIESLDRYCLDPDRLQLIVIVEEKNVPLFTGILGLHPRLASRIITTEDVLAGFGILDTPAQFLARIGKFTFQTLKKFGGLLAAQTDWSLVLDSEGLFQKPFRAMQLLQDYAEQKYVFYTWTTARGKLWLASTGYQVNANTTEALGMPASKRWYMEYFHWFYETAKVRDLVQNHLGHSFFEHLASPDTQQKDFFENILYYLFLEKEHGAEYQFIDFKAEIDDLLPPALSERFRLSELPFSLFGNEYLLNILSPDDIPLLAPLFDKYKLPFVRLEPPYFSTRYLPALAALPSFVATISSHHAVWLKKKIAVCISGEFRHIVHRTPEHHVRHLAGFLAGVDCDIFLHGWSNASEALIVDALKPRAYLFEPPMPQQFGRLARKIKVTEPNIKPGRDAGSLAMFHGIQRAYELMQPYEDEYDYVVRIRPDIYSEVSLKEILVKISDEGDLLPGTIYFPKQFHSKGINDQIAIGPVAEMRTYATTYDYVAANVDTLFFNPETALLRRLLESEVQIALVDIPYALMREVPFKINTIHHHFHQQFHVWWSRTEDLPAYQDLSAFFRDKLAAMDAMMRKMVADLVYVRAPATDGDTAVIRAKNFDNDPSRPMWGLCRRARYWQIRPFLIEKGEIAWIDHPVGRAMFLFPEGYDLIVSEWRMAKGRLVNNRIVAPPADVSPAARTFGVRITLSFYMERRMLARQHRRDRRAHRRHLRQERRRRRGDTLKRMIRSIFRR